MDAASLAQIQEFSEEEFRALEEESAGRGVMVWDSQVYLFDARMDKKNILYSKFSSNFHEKAEEKKLQEEQNAKLNLEKSKEQEMEG